jgi:hypothetical protein
MPAGPRQPRQHVGARGDVASRRTPRTARQHRRRPGELAADPRTERCHGLRADLPPAGRLQPPRVPVPVDFGAARPMQEGRPLRTEREDEAGWVRGAPPAVGGIVGQLHCVAQQVGGFAHRGYAGDRRALENMTGLAPRIRVGQLLQCEPESPEPQAAVERCRRSCGGPAHVIVCCSYDLCRPGRAQGVGHDRRPAGQGARPRPDRPAAERHFRNALVSFNDSFGDGWKVVACSVDAVSFVLALNSGG